MIKDGAKTEDSGVSPGRRAVLLEAANTLADARRTKVAAEQVAAIEYREEDYIVDEDAWVIVTRDGWVKRQKSFTDAASIRVRDEDKVGWVYRSRARHTKTSRRRTTSSRRHLVCPRFWRSMTRIAAFALVAAILSAAPATAQRMSYGKAPMPGGTSTPNGRGQQNGAGEGVVKVQPPRREDLQPSYAQVIKADTEDESQHGWYGCKWRDIGRCDRGLD